MKAKRTNRIFPLLIAAVCVLSFKYSRGSQVLGIFSPAISPDGSCIAFSGIWQSEPRKTGEKIFVMSLEDEKIHEIPEEEIWYVANSEPSWSLDSRKIALKFDHSYDPDGILVANRDGSQVEVVVSLPYEEYGLFSDICWCPDNKKIGFVTDRWRKDSTNVLWILDIERKSKRMLISDVMHASWMNTSKSWSWSPNGKEIFFIKKGDIYVTDITKGGFEKVITGTNAKSLSLSPNGNELLIIPQSHYAPQGQSILWRIALNGSYRERLIIDQLRVCLPVYSSDGNKIIFVGCEKISEVGKLKQVSNIYILDVNGKEQRRLTRDAYDIWPVVLPHNKGIVFVRNRNTLWLMNMDGSNQRQIFPKSD